MLDWKILAASIVALLFISSVFVGGFGLREFFSGVLDKTGEYLGSSPFDGIIPGEVSDGEKDVSVLLKPDSISLTPKSKATILTGDTVYNNYKGEIIISFINNTVNLNPSDVSISFPLDEMEIQSLEIDSLIIKEIPFEIEPDITTDSGNMDMKGFKGTALVTEKGLKLTGNVTRLVVEIGELNFELV